MEGKACKKDSFTLTSDMEPLQAKLCSNNVRTIALRLASFTTHLSVRSRLSVATFGEVEQRSREESIGRILANWTWDKLFMGWSKGRAKEENLEMRLMTVTTSTADLT